MMGSYGEVGGSGQLPGYAGYRYDYPGQHEPHPQQQQQPQGYGGRPPAMVRCEAVERQQLMGAPAPTSPARFYPQQNAYAVENAYQHDIPDARSQCSYPNSGGYNGANNRNNASFNVNNSYCGSEGNVKNGGGRQRQRYRRKPDPPPTQSDNAPDPNALSFIPSMVYQPSAPFNNFPNQEPPPGVSRKAGGGGGPKLRGKPPRLSVGSGRLGLQGSTDRRPFCEESGPRPKGPNRNSASAGDILPPGSNPGAGRPPYTMTVRHGVDRLYRHPRQHNYSHQSRVSDEVQDARQDDRQQKMGPKLPSAGNGVGFNEEFANTEAGRYSNSSYPYGRKTRPKGRRKGGDEAPDEVQSLSNSSTSNLNATSTKTSRKENYDTWRSNQNSFHQPNKQSSERPVVSSKNTNWRNREHRRLDSAEICQRERLTEQLVRGGLECLVCCDKVRAWHQVWACSNCHHILHLKCIIKWASTSKGDKGWRCPACQNFTMAVPSEYRCMCGKVLDPQNKPGDTPHCCGDVCGKVVNCRCGIHPCTLQCHPGPCPRCMASVDRKCSCGRTSQTLQCSSTVELTCGQICLKLLDCGRHYCQQNCHTGDCINCKEVLVQQCHCGGESREINCGECHDTDAGYSCGAPCPGKLTCGNHDCAPRECHSGPCAECPLDPSNVSTCPCSKTPLPEGQRSSCLDPIPTCGAVCEKLLPCGAPGKRHICSAECHSGDCPTCTLTTSVTCRCGSMKKELPCVELTTHADDARCQKKCSKKRSCGKHKCNQPCCIDLEHVCPVTCTKTLNCGRHRCQQLCHRGYCQVCTAVSFDELRCECGASVVLPPIPCGTRPPECSSVCTRPHPCDHPPLHTCHSMPTCPPCTVLTTKKCHGGHELRKAVPCHIVEFSCGRPCGKSLGCGHTCQKLCHAGDCFDTGSRGRLSCSQQCQEVRAGCGHPCAAPCHFPQPCPVPPTPCLAQVRITCQCGRRTAARSCSDNASEYRKIATSLLASKMADLQLGLSVDVDINCASKMSLKTLECNEECKVYERNLRLAIGLQIANPDLSNKLHPRYTENMLSWAKKDPHFCQMVHDQLTQLVQLAKESKMKSRSYSFDPMSTAKRLFVHEYCKHFGCESVAYDMEPKRNIVATAVKDKCWLPSYSLLEVFRRDAKRKVTLLPSLKAAPNDTEEQMKTLQKGATLGASSKPWSVVTPTTSTEEKDEEDQPPLIDYFDYKN